MYRLAFPTLPFMSVLIPSSHVQGPAQLDQARALKCREPSLGSRLRLGLARPGLEEGTQEMHNGRDKNVLNGQAAYLQFQFQHYAHTR